jgi:predicted N-acetyltransferase YhbS
VPDAGLLALRRFRGVVEDREMNIRRIDPADRPTISAPVQAYAFQPSRADEKSLARRREVQRYYEGNLTLVAEVDGAAVADVSAIPMRQNVRGTVYPMAGVAGVASQPLARRRGHVRALLLELLGQMRDAGHVVSALYPFRPSFYQRFGYVGVPKARTVTFSPADLAGLLRSDLPGEVRWERIGTGYDAYRQITHRLLAERHGFAVLADYRAVQVRDADDRWLVTAMARGALAGAATYRITGHGGELLADDMLTTGPLGRALLLRFFAEHVDQVASVSADISADETPELWSTDLAAVTEARVSFPTSPAPMARILSLDALAGMPVGPGRVVVEVVDDTFIAGRYELDGRSGALQVSRSPARSAAATLTAAGLSGLVYRRARPGRRRGPRAGHGAGRGGRGALGAVSPPDRVLLRPLLARARP